MRKIIHLIDLSENQYGMLVLPNDQVWGYSGNSPFYGRVIQKRCDGFYLLNQDGDAKINWSNLGQYKVEILHDSD